MSEILLIAASGPAREVLATVRSNGRYDVVDVLDNNEGMPGSEVGGAPVLGSIGDSVHYTRAFILVCLVSGRARKTMVYRLASLGIAPARSSTVMDPSVRMPEGCRIGRDSILLQDVTPNASVTLGSHVVAMPGVTFMHDDVVADFATVAVAAGTSLGGGVRIGRAAYHVKRAAESAGPRSQAIVPVQLFGQTAPVERLTALAAACGAAIVEDAAQSKAIEMNSRLDTLQAVVLNAKLRLYWELSYAGRRFPGGGASHRHHALPADLSAHLCRPTGVRGGNTDRCDEQVEGVLE